MKKLISLLLSVLLLLSIVPLGSMSVLAAATEKNTIITVKQTNAKHGATVDVDIVIENNSGILGMTLEVLYDEKVATLIGVQKGDALSAMTFTVPKNLASGCRLPWDAEDVRPEDIKDGTIATLTFKINDNAAVGTVSPIRVTYSKGAIIDKDMLILHPETVAGSITVLDYTPGDTNNDGIINTTDVVMLRRHIAGGYNVTITENAGDVNADGNLNTTDVVFIRRYVAGGYGVELKPAQTNCAHDITAVPATESTCVVQGHISHFRCTRCDVLFADVLGKTMLEKEDVLLALAEHTVVIDPAVGATTTTTGLTEGSHCGVCKVILKKQEIIPVISGYSISYHPSVGNSYIAQQTIDMSSLPNSYETGKETEIPDLPENAVPGFEFGGWYDAIEGGKRVDHIGANSTGNVRLYARWTAIPYEINYVIDAEAPYELKDSDGKKIPDEAKTYTVDKGKREFPVIRMDGYTFVGWSDEEGVICSSIPVGTTGDKKFYANWLSERNQAWAKKELGEPVILEQDNYILFAYEIGEVKNVPVYTMIDFGKINGNGVAYERTETYTTTVSETLMESYTKSLTDSTTSALSWTLSDGWSDAVSVNEEWAQENEITVEEAEKIGRTESENWYVSSGHSGGDSTVTLDTSDNYNLTTKTNNKKTFNTTDETKYQEGSVGIDLSLNHTFGTKKTESGELGLEGSAGKDEANKVGLSGKVGGSKEKDKSTGIGLGLNGKYTTGVSTDKKTGTEKDSGSSDQEGSVTHTGTTTTSHSEWNTESGYGGSSEVSQETSISQALSEKISEKTGYGKEYIQTGNQSETQDQSSTETNSEEYASSVTYEKVEQREFTETFSTANTVTGYHRIVMVTDAHVFGVIGYDIANDSYFVYTYSILDKDVRRFEDYSYKTGSYNDHENAVIPFNAPFDIAEYVAERTAYTDGLVISAAGEVMDYIGEQKTVVVPEYFVEKNTLDGTSTAIKITKISPTAFAGKDVEVIQLSDFITEIPDGAFKNCDSLLSVNGAGVTKIGKEAFAGCTELQLFALGDNIEKLGENAFSSADSLTVVTRSKDMVLDTLASGADKIKIIIADSCTDLSDIELAVPETVTIFVFDGRGKTFNNVRITSSADEVGIYNATFNSTGKIPLYLNTKDIELMKTTVNARGIAMVSERENANLMLYGESYLNTTGENVLLCKSTTLTKTAPASTHTELHVSGNVLVCDQISALVMNNLLTQQNSSLIAISANEFEKQKKGIVDVTFDAAGGAVDPAEKECFYGTAIGTLPVPVKEYHTFLGWFTEETAGEQVTEEYILSGTNELTLYAHWQENQWSEWTTDTSLLDSDLYTVEERVETRSRTKEFTTASTPSLDNWVKYDAVITDWTAWSPWSTTVYTESASRKVESQYVPAVTKTVYCYYRWVSADRYYGATYQVDSGYYYEYIELDYELGYQGQTDNGQVARYGPYGNYLKNIWYRNSTFTKTVTVQNAYTQYRYRDAVYTYHFYRWLDWTPWDVENVTPDENTEVETRTVYRYKLK